MYRKCEGKVKGRCRKGKRKEKGIGKVKIKERGGGMNRKCEGKAKERYRKGKRKEEGIGKVKRKYRKG